MTMPAPTSGPTAKTEKVENVISTFQPTRHFKSAGVHHTSLDFNDTGDFALLSRTDDYLHIYNTKKGVLASSPRSEKYGCALARFTHSDNKIVYASTKFAPKNASSDADDAPPSRRHAIRYHDILAGTYPFYFTGHTDRVTSLAVSPGTDGLLSASLDNTVKLWDTRTPNATGSLNLYGVTLVAHDPSATVLAIASPATQSVLLYDLKNFDKPPFATFDLLDIEKGYSRAGHVTRQRPLWTSLEFSNNGKYVLLGTDGDVHYLLDAFDGVLKAYLQRPAGPPGFPNEVNAKNGAVSHASASLQGGCCFTPDGRYVLGTHAEVGLVGWDASLVDAEGGVENDVLRPSINLLSKQTATVVGYSPKHNLVVSAGSGVMFWLPVTDVL